MESVQSAKSVVYVSALLIMAFSLNTLGCVPRGSRTTNTYGTGEVGRIRSLARQFVLEVVGGRESHEIVDTSDGNIATTELQRKDIPSNSTLMAMLKGTTTIRVSGMRMELRKTSAADAMLYTTADFGTQVTVQQNGDKVIVTALIAPSDTAK